MSRIPALLALSLLPTAAWARGPFADVGVHVSGLHQSSNFAPYAGPAIRGGFAFGERFEQELSVEWRGGESEVDLGDFGEYTTRVNDYGVGYRLNITVREGAGLSPTVAVGGAAGITETTLVGEWMGVEVADYSAFVQAALGGGARYSFASGFEVHADLSGVAELRVGGIAGGLRAAAGAGFRF